MNTPNEFLSEIDGSLHDRIIGSGLRPPVEVWPDEDGFGAWVASHQDPVRTIICNTPEFASAPFCGRGSH